MKRVLSLATLYPNSHQPRFGTFVARSLEALARTGDWHVTVINPIGIPPVAFGKYKPLRAAAISGEENGIEVHRPVFPLIPKLGTAMNPALIARSVRQLALRLHDEKRFHLMDAQFFYPDGPAAARLAKELRTPLSIKARGSDISYWGTRKSARKQMMAAAGQAAGLLAVSQALSRDMQAMGMDAAKIAVHYTGLDRDRFRPLDHTGLRAKLGAKLGIALSDDERLIATVGALIDRKGQDLVIGAVARMPGTRLLLVGTGDDRARLEGLAKGLDVADRVHFLGSVDHDLLPVILSAADAMALPSASEGLANAWVESLACGTPIVIADAGGARELVTDDAAGLIVDRTVDAVELGLLRVMNAPPRPETVAAAIEQFSWDANGAALAEYYNRLTA